MVAQFLFEPHDLVVAVGQDGLVANVGKYLDGQPLAGVNPDPDTIDGSLLAFNVDTFIASLNEVLNDRRPVREATLAEAQTSDRQSVARIERDFRRRAEPSIGALSHPARQRGRGAVVEWADRLDRHGFDGLVEVAARARRRCSIRPRTSCTSSCARRGRGAGLRRTSDRRPRDARAAALHRVAHGEARSSPTASRRMRCVSMPA